MPGQATVTINEDQWNVWVASTYTELTTGLSGRESIPAGTGMLFVLPEKRPVTVDTSQMLFPLDIIFISESLVVDVASNIQPGYLVTEETPCDMFLEVNAGETAGVEVGDAVTTATIQQPGTNFGQIVSFAIPLAALGFVCTMAGGMARLMGGSSSSPKRGELPQGEKIWYLGEYWEEEYSTAECVVYRSADGKKRLYVYWDGTKEVKPVPPIKPESLPQTNPGKFEPGEIVDFKGERVRVRKNVGDRVSIWVPSRQEEALVKPESLEK